MTSHGVWHHCFTRGAAQRALHTKFACRSELHFKYGATGVHQKTSQVVGETSRFQILVWRMKGLIQNRFGFMFVASGARQERAPIQRARFCEPSWA